MSSDICMSPDGGNLEEVGPLRTPDQAAEYLVMSRMQVYRLMQSGALRYVQVGGRARRIPLRALEEFLRARMVHGTA